MVTFVKGDMFRSPAQVLTNTVNCDGVMGKGVALKFKNRYPQMFGDYNSKCDQGKVKPGRPYLWEDDSAQVLNFPTKRHWREIAFGIAQITPETFKALQDPKGEVKDFIFNDIRKKDLKDPNINIPMAVRWVHRKKRLAEGKLGRAATAEEVILEYKGLLKSSSSLKNKALENFRKNYGQLKSK